MSQNLTFVAWQLAVACEPNIPDLVEQKFLVLPEKT